MSMQPPFGMMAISYISSGHCLISNRADSNEAVPATISVYATAQRYASITPITTP